jgi:hypothetical protein
MTARAEDLATTFRTWSASREVTLQRSAYLLTGDVPAARLRVRDALATALATGPAGPDDLDTAALRALLAGGSATGSDLVLAHSDDVGTDPRQRVVWDYLSTLGRAERAVLVLGFHRGLDESDTAALLGLTVAETSGRADAALEDLGGLLHLPRVETEALLRATLEARAAGLRVVPLTYSQVTAVSRGRRTRRFRTAALLACGAAATVLVAAAALSGGGLPPPPTPAPAPPSPGQSSGFLPGDMVPPPWVLPPGANELRVDLETRCSSPADEEFRSVTTIQSGCRTYVVKSR